MIRLLLGRFKEGKALSTLEAALQGRGAPETAIEALKTLQEIGSARSIPAMCLALTHGQEAVRAEVPAALAAVHQRHADNRILEALNAAVLSDRQSEKVRIAAVEALAEVIDARHVGSFLEVLRTPRSPLGVRAAAANALARLGYPELFERLTENYLFDRKSDPQDAIRQWVVRELKALDDPDKLRKLHEIAHGRRRLKYHSFSFERGDPGAIVNLMAQVDPEHAVRFLSHMVDHSTTIISAAAAEALREIKAKHRDAPGANTHHR